MEHTPREILIVDDELAITSALDTLLTQAGYRVTQAHSGPEALRALVAVPFDLVILDVMLPGMDGYEVCRRIRQVPTYIPVVMLTARDELTDRVVGLELGADLYLTKPFEPRVLLAQMKALFRLVGREGQGAVAAAAAPCVCGALTLWEEQHRVELDGVPVHLTPKEYELLRVFMRAPGRVFGRETLLRRVWGYEFAGDTRTVDMHIQRLRAKIEADPAQPQRLQTVRGFGYRLATDDPPS